MNILVVAASGNFFVKAWDVFVKYQPLLISGIINTLIAAFVGTIVGLVIGLIVGAIRAITMKSEVNDSTFVRIIKKVIFGLTSFYVAIFRGTPMMVQAMFLYYALLPIIGWTPMVAACVIISVNTGAYMAEIIRSGIQSVDAGQSEAARSIGMSAMQTMRHIVLPQAIKNSFPSIGNEFIVNIKDSCVLNCIAFTELFFQAKSIAGATFSFVEPYFVVGCIYFILTYATSILLGFVEKKLNNTKSSYPSSQTHEKTKISSVRGDA